MTQTHVSLYGDYGDYGDELMRHRGALVAQVHATLGLIEAVEKLTDASS